MMKAIFLSLLVFLSFSQQAVAADNSHALLCAAVQNNDAIQIKILKLAGADLNDPCEEAGGLKALIPLAGAWGGGKIEAFAKLLELGADPNKKTGWTRETASGPRKETSITLIQDRLDKKDEDFFEFVTTKQPAAYSQKVRDSVFYLFFGGKSRVTGPADAWAHAPKWAQIEALLRTGPIDVDYGRSTWPTEGETLLFWSWYAGDPVRVQYLLDHGARPYKEMDTRLPGRSVTSSGFLTAMNLYVVGKIDLDRALTWLDFAPGLLNSVGEYYSPSRDDIFKASAPWVVFSEMTPTVFFQVFIPKIEAKTGQSFVSAKFNLKTESVDSTSSVKVHRKKTRSLVSDSCKAGLVEHVTAFLARGEDPQDQKNMEYDYYQRLVWDSGNNRWRNDGPARETWTSCSQLASKAYIDATDAALKDRYYRILQLLGEVP